MEIQILKTERMAESGSSLPDMMKNKSLRLLDLFVREAIQNSLDATLEKSEKNTVEVEINVDKFKSEELNRFFIGISDKLNSKYSGDHHFISISDKKTEGLTGNPEKDNDKSNLQKLIYNISQPQEAQGSGGSNGLGKTTFFKLGMGIVIYYSRIYIKGVYESRLAATLVEDERNSVFVKEEDYRGIAFFGKYSSKSKSGTGKYRKTIPITDADEINKILCIFNLKPYKNDETGTTVIIPYIDYEKLRSETLPKGEGRVPYWTGKIEDYLKISVQRWYAPRLNNPDYKGAWLKVRVNGEPLGFDTMEPLFRLFRELYNKTYSQYKEEKSEFGTIYTRGVKSNHIKTKTAGYVSWIRLNVKALGLTDEYYRNIYSLIGDYEANLKSPIITYTRQPGMLIRYDMSNSKWVPSVTDLGDGEVVIGVFRLDSENLIQSGNESLEKYVRGCERADHHEWVDKTGSSIIDSISNAVAKNIQKYYSVESVPESLKKYKVSALLSEMLLPQTDVGSTYRTVDEKRIKHKGNKKKLKTEITSLSQSIENGRNYVYFTINISNEHNSVRLYPAIKTENGTMHSKEWEYEFGKKFPINMQVVSMECDGKDMPCENRGRSTRYALELNEKHSNADALYIRAEGESKEISGRVLLESSLENLIVSFICEGGRDDT